MKGQWSTAAIFGDDATSEAGAYRLKQQIERYWRERGFEVHLRLVKGAYQIGARQASYQIQSDMINGLPRQCIKAERAA